MLLPKLRLGHRPLIIVLNAAHYTKLIALNCVARDPKSGQRPPKPRDPFADQTHMHRLQ